MDTVSCLLSLEGLKDNIRNVMPVLDTNLSKAHEEYMRSDLSAGAFGVVRSRHELALAVMSASPDQVPDLKKVFAACAFLSVDISTGAKDCLDETAAKTLLEAWWDFFRSSGLTQVNCIFEVPMFPEGQTAPV